MDDGPQELAALLGVAPDVLVRALGSAWSRCPGRRQVNARAYDITGLCTTCAERHLGVRY
ncbi:hypothetical protein [Geodermatophilus sp. SYSU D00684]